MKKNSKVIVTGEMTNQSFTIEKLMIRRVFGFGSQPTSQLKTYARLVGKGIGCFWLGSNKDYYDCDIANLTLVAE